MVILTGMTLRLPHSDTDGLPRYDVAVQLRGSGRRGITP